MLDHKHETLTEIHTLMAAPITVQSLTKSEKQGFEYPVSGDALALLKEHGPITAGRIMQQRSGERP